MFDRVLNSFLHITRSSPPEVSIKKGVFKNFAKFTGKHLCQSLFFNKIAGRRPATSLKKRLWHRCFPENLAKFFRTLFLRKTSGWLRLYHISIFPYFFFSFYIYIYIYIYNTFPYIAISLKFAIVDLLGQKWQFMMVVTESSDYWMFYSQLHFMSCP